MLPEVPCQRRELMSIKDFGIHHRYDHLPSEHGAHHTIQGLSRIYSAVFTLPMCTFSLLPKQHLMISLPPSPSTRTTLRCIISTQATRCVHLPELVAQSVHSLQFGKASSNGQALALSANGNSLGFYAVALSSYQARENCTELSEKLISARFKDTLNANRGNQY